MSKLWVYIAGAFGALLATLNITQRQRDKAKLEADRQARARMAENTKRKQATDISKARVKANERAKETESEAINNRGKRPTGKFADKRLSDDS